MAILTSANLTQGGISRNYEYGVVIEDSKIVETIYRDLISYSVLGVRVDSSQLTAYCQLAIELRKEALDLTKLRSISQGPKIGEKSQRIDDELLRMRLRKDTVHATFEKTVQYLLQKYGALSTKDIHPLVAEIHPDLCDDSVDRVIDGKHFGKKWQHAVRSAQAKLQEKGIIEINESGKWELIP